MKRPLQAPLALALSLLAGVPAHADAITDWNQAADGFITEAKLGTPPAVRVMALLQTAVADAVAATPDKASAEAAIAGAHRVVLSRLLPAQQAAVVVDLAGAGGVHHRPGTVKEQRLEQAVIDHVQQGAGDPQQDQGRHGEAAPEQGQAEADGDDADVLDAVVGEQALEVVLGQRQGYAADPGDDAEQ